MPDAINDQPAQVLPPDVLLRACGMTVDFDLREIGQPKPGENVGKLIIQAAS